MSDKTKALAKLVSAQTGASYQSALQFVRKTPQPAGGPIFGRIVRDLEMESLWYAARYREAHKS